MIELMEALLFVGCGGASAIALYKMSKENDRDTRLYMALIAFFMLALATTAYLVIDKVFTVQNAKQSIYDKYVLIGKSDYKILCPNVGIKIWKDGSWTDANGKFHPFPEPIPGLGGVGNQTLWRANSTIAPNQSGKDIDGGFLPVIVP